MVSDELLKDFRSCFIIDINDFIYKSDNKEAIALRSLSTFELGSYTDAYGQTAIEFIKAKLLKRIVDKELNKIIDILLKDPDANHFYYEDGHLYYCLPNERVINGNSMLLNGPKTKEFLKLLRRDIKLTQILDIKQKIIN